MNKTKFYKEVIKHFFNKDADNLDDMEYHCGDRNYEIPVSESITKDVDKVHDDFNGFFKAIGLNYEMPKVDVIKKVQETIKRNSYDQKLRISIHFEDIYNQLIDNKVIEANEIVQVLRIENDSFVGVYKHFNNKDDSLSNDFENTRNTIAPGQDGVLFLQFMNADYREKSVENIFGFENNQSMLNWLLEADGFLNKLTLEDNLYISTYEVSSKDLLIGHKQVCFNKERSKCIKREKLNSVFKGRLELALYEKEQKENPENITVVKDFLKQDDGDVLPVSNGKIKKNKKRNNSNQMSLF